MVAIAFLRSMNTRLSGERFRSSVSESPPRLFVWAPMGRQYVHLSVEVETARAVGQRKAAQPVILAVAAQAASRSGVALYAGNAMVWLADRVPAQFISLIDV